MLLRDYTNNHVMVIRSSPPIGAPTSGRRHPVPHPYLDDANFINKGGSREGVQCGSWLLNGHCYYLLTFLNPRTECSPKHWARLVRWRCRSGGTLLTGQHARVQGVELPAFLRSHTHALERLRMRSTRQVLTVATDFAFANFWLMPRLAAFQQTELDLDVLIVTSQNEFDIRDGSVNLAVWFGGGQSSGCDAVPARGGGAGMLPCSARASSRCAGYRTRMAPATAAACT